MGKVHAWAGCRYPLAEREGYKADAVDLEPANAAPILQATEADLHGILEGGFGASLTLRRNYGDWLRVEASAGQDYRLQYYDAAAGKRFASARTWALAEVQAAVEDYFEGRWNWHQQAVWREC
jgi:hypothetical protein